MSRQAGYGSDVLRSGGHRLTPQRHLVLRALEEAGHHLSAEEISQRVQVVYPNISLSTVYRTLELLVRLGLVLEARLGGGRRAYELAGEAGAHTHLICRSCGAVGHPRMIDLQPQRAHLAAETGYADIALDLVATGLCPRCSLAASADSATSAAPTTGR